MKSHEQHPSGAGLSTVIMSFLLTTYYNVIMAWALFYLVYSFSPSLPWEVSQLNKTIDLEKQQLSFLYDL